MAEWNDREIPIAYLFTFRCYGTWLHGDERGSVNRFRNQFRTRRLPRVKAWIDKNKGRLKSNPVRLDSRMRRIVEEAISETCTIRRWQVIAINVRTNHVHAVLSIGTKNPSAALNAMKANATRKLRENGLWDSNRSPWSARGSKRYLWNEKSVFHASDYVLNGQGGELPEFD